MDREKIRQISGLLPKIIEKQSNPADRLSLGEYALIVFPDNNGSYKAMYARDGKYIYPLYSPLFESTGGSIEEALYSLWEEYNKRKNKGQIDGVVYYESYYGE